MTLPEGWKRSDDLSWRVSSWPLRRMVLGGAALEEATAEQLKAAGLPEETTMALRIRHIGQYGPHAAAKQAGFRTGDLIISFNGRNDLSRETDLLAYGVNALQPGQTAEVTVVRGKKQVQLKLPRQN
jgi:serine protease Do